MKVSNELICFSYVISKQYRGMIDEIAKQCDMTNAELSVLLYIIQEEKDTASEIAAGRCMSKASVSKAVESLYQKEFIVGEPDSADRRVVHLKIQPKAECVMKMACESKAELVNRIFQDFSDEEIEFMEHAVRRIIKNLNENC